MDLSETLSSARSTAGAVLGQTGALFGGDGIVHRAQLAIDDDARIPRHTRLLIAGQTRALVAKTGAAGGIHTVCLKFPDVYGPGRDQDFLLASSGDGAPLHHVTLATAASTLYSSLWLYFAGVTPVLFGLRTDGSALRAGAVAEFCVSAPIGKFRRIGAVTFNDVVDDGAALTFAGRHSGGNIRPLPPVSLY